MEVKSQTGLSKAKESLHGVLLDGKTCNTAADSRLSLAVTMFQIAEA